MRRLTRCVVPGHGTRCEAVPGRDTHYCRATARRIAFRHEQEANR